MSKSQWQPYCDGPADAQRLAQLQAVADARDWLLDCFPNDADEILALGDIGIVQAMQRHYEGGWGQFALDGQYFS